MRGEAAGLGFYESPWGKHPSIQLRTVGELLAGQGINYPHVAGANVTHRRASRAVAEPAPRAVRSGGRDGPALRGRARRGLPTGGRAEETPAAALDRPYPS